MKRPSYRLRIPDSLAELPRGMHPHLKKKNKAPLALILSNPTELGRKTVILTGIEAHICILQTALDLLQAGFSVHVPVDAVCSRSKEHWKVAIEQLQMAGAVITCAETVAFELLQEAGAQDFKALSKLFR